MQTKLILPLFIAFIMIFSVVGFAISQSFYTTPQEQVTYNGLNFVQNSQGSWLTYINKNPVSIVTYPPLLGNIILPEVSLVELNSANKIYVTFNQNETVNQAIIEFQTNILPYLKPVNQACIEDSPSCANLPIKSCLDATEDTKIIQFQEADVPFVIYQDNCLLIQGSSYDLTTQTDALILYLLS